MLLKVDSSYISWNQRKKEFRTAKNIHTNFRLGIWHRWILWNKILAVIWADIPNTQTTSFLLASKCYQSCVFHFFLQKNSKILPRMLCDPYYFSFKFFLVLVYVISYVVFGWNWQLLNVVFHDVLPGSLWVWSIFWKVIVSLRLNYRMHYF